MQQIYRQSDQQFEVYTTVFSPQVCRARSRHVEPEKVMVAVAQHRAGLQRELDLSRGDRVLVLYREDEAWWFGRRSDGQEGYFPPTCVQPLQVCGASCRATPPLLRRGSVPAVRTTPSAPCGCTSGHSTPRQLRKSSLLLKLEGPPEPEGGAGSAHSSPSLLHRVLAKSRRMSCPHLPHLPLRPPDHGSINTAFQPD
ncbi:uncharacterized protein si:dkey-97a13.12 [Eleginops maclovinus]|uniref:uncharacterized protein si:dkey-97a13.12 n=1 Tax=Eleginops maclovinus TaxID=56733 RepID=UPI0030800A57